MTTGGRTRTTLYLPTDLHRRLRVQAAVKGTTMTDIVVSAITSWLDRQDVSAEPAEVRR